MIKEYASSAASLTQVTASIVSHGHGRMVMSLLTDLATKCGSSVNVILTQNIHESLTIDEGIFPFPLKVLKNAVPKGFGANHNAAFKQSPSEYFCVLNPDIRLTGNPFPQLVEELRKPEAGVVAPRILNPGGADEDNARRFPTPWFLLRKAVGLARGLDYEISTGALSPDWVAGMFMLFRGNVFTEIGGFDERYFLYYEDVDLCRRLRRRGYAVRLLPDVKVIHDARRESRRNLRHMRWHLASMLRFLASR